LFKILCFVVVVECQCKLNSAFWKKNSGERNVAKWN